MSDITAEITKKGTQSTGITEDLVQKMHDQLGKKLMCVVELESFTRGENLEGKEKVQIRIISIEPATTQVGEDHLRSFERALFMNRKLDEDGPMLPDGEPEPTVKDVLDQAKGLVEHDDDGEVTGLWDGTDADSGLDVDPDSPIPDTTDTGGGGAINTDTGAVTPAGEPLPDAPDPVDQADEPQAEDTPGPWPGDPDFSARRLTSVD